MTESAKPVGQVFWSVLSERSIPGTAANALINCAMIAGAHGFRRISVPYMRTDWARNLIVRAFLDETEDPNDLLNMLDCDHKHPQDILLKMAAHPPHMGIVGALAFRRGPPYEAMFFIRDAGGRLRSPAEWEPGCYECEAVGMGAVAIRRWVFTRLDEAVHGWPYFRFTYPPENAYNKSEDVYFCEIARQAEIKIYCNTSVCTPHLGEHLIDDQLWFEQNVKRVPLANYEQEMAMQQAGGVSLPQIATRVNA